MAVVRTDADCSKGYNFALASSPDSAVFFNGPYKDFPEHHFISPIPVERLFGHTPFKKK